MKRTLLNLFFLLVFATGSRGDEIKVASAADLTYVMQDLAANFHAKTGNTVALSFASSGILYSQITSGAPYDIFFSADSAFPKKLADAGKIVPASIREYAVGVLVIWVPNSSGLDPQKLKIDVLTQPSVRRIAIANPEHAPYGRAAMAALKYFGLETQVRDKLVMGENISQAAQFVQSGNAQAGLIAESLAISAPMRNAGKFWKVSPESYPEVKQTVGVLALSQHKSAAQAFVDYVTSGEGARILEQSGFGIPSSR